MYRKEVTEVLQKQFALAKQETFTLLPLRQKACIGLKPASGPDRHLVNTAYDVSEHECMQSKIMRLS